MRALCKDTRGLTAPLPSLLLTAERFWPGMIPPGVNPLAGKAGDVAHYLSTVTAQGIGAKASALPPHSTGRTDCSAGADRQARSLHGRNRASLVRSRKFRQPVRESTPAADPTLVRVLVASPRRYPAYRGVAHRHWHEGCGSHLDQPCWCPRDSLRPRSIRRRSKPGRMRLLHWRLLPMTPWTIFLDVIPVLALGLAIVSLPLIADGPPQRRDPAKE